MSQENYDSVIQNVGLLLRWHLLNSETQYWLLEIVVFKQISWINVLIGPSF